YITGNGLGAFLAPAGPGTDCGWHGLDKHGLEPEHCSAIVGAGLGASPRAWAVSDGFPGRSCYWQRVLGRFGRAHHYSFSTEHSRGGVAGGVTDRTAVLSTLRDDARPLARPPAASSQPGWPANCH